MSLLAQVQIPLDEVMKILGWLLGVIIGLGAVIAGFVKLLHSDMKKSVECIHDDLKPLILDVTQIKVEIINIKEDHKELKDTVTEQNRWINSYDSRIQATERTLAVMNKNQ